MSVVNAGRGWQCSMHASFEIVENWTEIGSCSLNGINVKKEIKSSLE